jgi:hypothetical protein
MPKTDSYVPLCYSEILEVFFLTWEWLEYHVLYHLAKFKYKNVTYRGQVKITNINIRQIGLIKKF